VSLRVVHASLASVTAAAAFALIAAGLFAAVRRSEYSIRLVLLVRRVAIIAAVLAAVLGVVLFIGGSRPHSGLHLMYGVLAVIAVPVAAQMAARQPRRGGLYHVLAGLLLLGFCFRLATA
jgi:hypothetical protein